MHIKTITLIGVGLMGRRIAQTAARCHYNVCLFDKDIQSVKNFVDTWKNEIHDKDETLKLGTITCYETMNEAVSISDLIIEAVPENVELKRTIFSQIDKIAPSHAILATNSSSLPVSMLEDAVKRKEKVLNLHFYMGMGETLDPLADIMRGNYTSDETYEKGLKFIQSLNFSPIQVKKESFGFIFNRIWRSIKKESLKIWAEGYGDFKDVDLTWRIITKMPVGPFQIMDMIGLDVVYDIEMSYYKRTGNFDDKPPQALKDMIDQGICGKKTKKGFYMWE